MMHVLKMSVLLFAATAFIMLGLTESASAGEHLGNVQRTGYVPTEMKLPLHLNWEYGRSPAPRPAWPEPKWELQRIDFDYVYQTVTSDGHVYFGSSTDHSIKALRLSTGVVEWTFYTEGPVRLAPAVSDGKVFVASDDGVLYCLDAKTGKLLWRFRGGPRDERLIGNDQMISRWPGRSGVLVEDGKVYTTFGMWSRDGVYIYCLNAGDGSVVWKNDTSGFFYTLVPHDQGMSGVAPQGHLGLYKGTLIVAAGRAVPAYFDAATGKLLFHQCHGLFAGGAWTMVSHDMAFFLRGTSAKPEDMTVAALKERRSVPTDNVAVFAMSIPGGEQKLLIEGSHRAVIAGDRVIVATADALAALSISELMTPRPAPKKKTPKYLKERERLAFLKSIQKWNTPVGRTFTLFQSGQTVFAGGDGKVMAVNAADGKLLWEAPVQGQARGLNVQGGRLIVSTTTGNIYCFGPTAGQSTDVRTEPAQPEATKLVQEKAAAILRETGVKEGYCLMLGGANWELALALVEQSKLTIYCLEPDAAKAAAARRILDVATMYGQRVTVHVGGPGKLPYADYFADLVVVDESVAGDVKKWSAREVYRVLHPFGGVATVDAKGGVEWLKTSGASAAEIKAKGTSIVRGALKDAGQWTHQYADAGRSSASTDKLVQLPLKMLWWGGPGPAKMVSRHWKGATPLFVRGRMFVPAEDALMAVDAYNGRALWQRDLPGLSHYPHSYRGGNICADDENIYALQGLNCLQLDAVTGQTRRTFTVPVDKARLEQMAKDLPTIKEIGGPPTRLKYKPVPAPPEWDFLAVSNGIVVGSLAMPHRTLGWWPRAFPEGKVLFAFDVETGELKWTFDATDAVDPNAISLSENRVFLIDRTSDAKFKRLTVAGKEPQKRSTLKALDLMTGKVVWTNPKITLSLVALWRRDDVLVVTRAAPSGALGAVRAKIETPSMQAFAAESGKELWHVDRWMHNRNPVITSDTVYTRGGAFDLHTGREKIKTDPLTGKPVTLGIEGRLLCSAYSGAENILMHRSGSLGLVDIKGAGGHHHYPNIRAGCWVNMIAAGGMLLVPEASSSCGCAYNYKTSVAMVPARRHEDWSTYMLPSDYQAPKDPVPALVKHMRMNLAAPGDQRDAKGRLWLSLPRPRINVSGKLARKVFPLPVESETLTDLQRCNADATPIRGAKTPWLYNSCARGQITLTMTLGPPADAGERAFRVVLHFAELEDVKPGDRVFDVKLQGKVVAERLDIIKLAGGRFTAVTKELRGIKAGGTMTLELINRGKLPPILNALEVLAE